MKIDGFKLLTNSQQCINSRTLQSQLPQDTAPLQKPFVHCSKIQGHICTLYNNHSNATPEDYTRIISPLAHLCSVPKKWAMLSFHSHPSSGVWGSVLCSSPKHKDPKQKEPATSQAGGRRRWPSRAQAAKQGLMTWHHIWWLDNAFMLLLPKTVSLSHPHKLLVITRHFIWWELHSPGFLS